MPYVRKMQGVPAHLKYPKVVNLRTNELKMLYIKTKVQWYKVKGRLKEKLRRKQAEKCSSAGKRQHQTKPCP